MCVDYIRKENTYSLKPYSKKAFLLGTLSYYKYYVTTAKQSLFFFL